MDENVELLRRHPTMIRPDPNRDEYRGCFLNTDYTIRLKRENGKIVLKSLDDRIDRTVVEAFECNSFCDFLQKIHDALSIETPLRDHSTSYRKILTEFSELTQFYINMREHSLADDLTAIRLSYSDEKDRSHRLAIAIDLNRDNLYKVIECDLTWDACDDYSSLRQLYEEFFHTVDRLQGFFDILDEIDERCTVLDPQKPTRRDSFRRIFLGENVSLVAIWDPDDCYQRPTLKCLGPERCTKTFRENIERNLENWDCGGNVVDELLLLLGLEEFPKGQSNRNEMLLYDEQECCICFQSNLNGKLPEIVCCNRSCEQLFHVDCLRQWLIAVESKKYATEIGGPCPNCEKVITCPI